MFFGSVGAIYLPHKSFPNDDDDNNNNNVTKPLIPSYDAITADMSVASMEQQDEPWRGEDDNDEYVVDRTVIGTTNRQSFVHLLKGYVGPGCLSLPWAFSQLGLVYGTVACFGLAYWSSYNCWTVVTLKRHLTPQCHTYPDVAQVLYGSKMKQVTVLSVCVQQLAICTVFLSFVGANLQAVLQTTLQWPVNHVGVLTLALPAIIGLSFLPNLKALAPVTAVGTALLLLGLGLLAVVVAIEWPHRPTRDTAAVQWNQVPLALCAILYSYEGICLILPIETSMQKPQAFLGVFASSMVSSATIFATVAVMSVAAFGNVTNGSITAFLLEHYADDASIQKWIVAANAAVSLSVLVTYPLQLFPCLELVGPLLSSRGRTTDFDPVETGEAVYVDNDIDADSDELQPSQQRLPPNVATRLVLVFLTYFIAVLVPNVQAIISLAGALAGSSTALILPPLLELAHARQNNLVSGVRIYKCYVLLAGGFLFLCIGTFAALADIVRIYRSGA